MKKCILILSVVLVSQLIGCSYLDRSDRLRKFTINKDQVGINITDATKRLAIIYPNGRTCSELSPPAVLEVDKAFKAGGKVTNPAGITGEGELETKKKTTAVKLLKSTEKIECLRISLFHACALAASEKMTAEQEINLYGKAIKTCYGSSETLSVE